jgi:hypothetical protein
MNKNIYQEAEDLVFKNRPAQYALDIQADRKEHKDSRLLCQHTEAVEKMVNTLESSSQKEQKITAKDFHSSLPPNPADQAIPHGINNLNT